MADKRDDFVNGMGAKVEDYHPESGERAVCAPPARLAEGSGMVWGGGEAVG